jgi:glutaredoxin
MDSTTKRILEFFDHSGAKEVEVSALVEWAMDAAEQATRATREQAAATVKQLIERGWLRALGRPELLARTEDGRLALAGPRAVTLYTRLGCHLCEEAKAQMAPLLREFGARLQEVNIDADPALRERYSNDIPVVFLGARKVAKHRIDLAQLRRQLQQAR